MEAWQFALNSNFPTVLVLTRQNIPLLRVNDEVNIVEEGGYAIIDFQDYDATIISTGSELEIAYESSKILLDEGIKVRIVSLPSWEIFDKKSEEHKNNIMGIKPLFAIEAGVVNGWEKYIPNKNFIGMKSFGASGPYKELYDHFNITSEAMVNLIKNRIG